MLGHNLATGHRFTSNQALHFDGSSSSGVAVPEWSLDDVFTQSLIGACAGLGILWRHWGATP